jgi:hypothetical protein
VVYGCCVFSVCSMQSHSRFCRQADISIARQCSFSKGDSYELLCLVQYSPVWQGVISKWQRAVHAAEIVDHNPSRHLARSTTLVSKTMIRKQETTHEKSNQQHSSLRYGSASPLRGQMQHYCAQRDGYVLVQHTQKVCSTNCQVHVGSLRHYS